METSDKRCALLILDNLSPSGKPVSGKYRNDFYSTSFEKDFGKVTWPEKFGFKWPFMQDYCFGKRMKLDGTILLTLNEEEMEFNYQFFYNSFNVFVLFFPHGEKRNTRTKIVFS